jgi:2-oxopent-4-enoate/cis-2-oxohex-4-enoate hydratase
MAVRIARMPHYAGKTRDPEQDNMPGVGYNGRRIPTNTTEVRMTSASLRLSVCFCLLTSAFFLLPSFVLLPSHGFQAPAQARQAGPPAAPALAETLAPSASNAEIARHALAARQMRRTMPSLLTAVPTLDRARAYEIQLATLKERQKTDALAGWKLGWSRAQPNTPLDPVFGYIMQGDVYKSGQDISAKDFVGGTAGVEIEVGVWVTRDLRGPRVTRDEVMAAAEVAAAIEFVASRIPGRGTREHAIVDDVYTAGVIMGSPRVKAASVDFSRELGWAEINGVKKAEGPARSIMDKDPVEAVVWLANELPKHGLHLRAGDVVVSGTVAGPPPARAGDKVTVSFTTLGSVGFEMVP